MTKRMLIDATHAEETRVVVLDGSRLEDFDVETSTKKQLKGNIYLAKVVRVEPSLQAAFVEYGGNRHGFLAFSEIHPDYYQIPVADRQRLLELQAEEARREDEEAELELALTHSLDQPDAEPEAQTGSPEPAPRPAAPADTSPEAWAMPNTPALIAPDMAAPEAVMPKAAMPEGTMPAGTMPAGTMPEGMDQAAATSAGTEAGDTAPADAAPDAWALPSTPRLLAVPRPPVLSVVADEEPARETAADAIHDADEFDPADDLPPPETVGGSDHDSGDDSRERRLTSRFLRNYKIQEVIRRRQILLVQVVKEERGTKGAALTTYLSLAGRFGVLMPNSPRGGGISRKITSATDRRRLKEVMTELDIPRGMGLIVRTAGANRPKQEIKRDFEYLLRLWDDIRDHTLKSVAPALIYEEASLIKRAIRDVYSRDIDEILVDGEEGWRAAHEFMRMLMPSHARKVQMWRDGGQPLFARSQVEAQLDAMLSPTVQLRSGGYLVINQTEALVAIDVNSGRSTRERNVEETALRTNLEAADEASRQLRLRDLAGLIVIDFIDMESKRHNAMVERRIKEALKNDRARIQVGHISHFGLLEMSRQRLRPSLAETSFIPCPHCGGTGHVRSTENAAIHVLRGIEDEGGKRRAAEVVVHCATPIALYLLNHKRERLREIEQRYHMHVIIAADDTQTTSQFRIDRVRVRAPEDFPAAVTPDRPTMAPPPAEIESEDEDLAVADEDDDDEEEARADSGATAESAEDANRRRRRRRRRRGGRREDEAEVTAAAGDDDDESRGAEDTDAGDAEIGDAEAGDAEIGDAETGDVVVGRPDVGNAEAGARRPARTGRGRGPAPRGAEGAVDARAEGQAEPSGDVPAGFAGNAASSERPAAAAPSGEPRGDEAQGAEAHGSDGQGGDAQGSDAQGGDAQGDDDPRARRRGRRGGRRRRRDGENEVSPLAMPGAEQPEVAPAYAGPTPADPFGGQVFDIFDVIEQVEMRATPAKPTPATEIANTAAPSPDAEIVPPPVPDDVQGARAEAVGESPAMHEAPGGVAQGTDLLAEAAKDEAGEAPPAPIHNGAAPEPLVETMTATADPVGAEPATEAAAEPEHVEPPPPTPAILPILVGAAGDAAAEKKRGWWRR